QDAFFATTAPTAIATTQAQHLETAYGVRIVGSSARLADRAGLAEDLETAGAYDVLLTELKAAAVDVACRYAAARGADVVFVDIRLLERRRASVTSAELAQVAIAVIGEVAGERYATNFVRWREIETLDVPLVILIGGATGVGKSTIATQLAARLGIVRIVATDAIREVMRAMLSSELMPTLHVSSFQADEALREPPTKTADALTLGFREQTAAVSVGINALIERAAAEGTSIVIEGAHIVPGFFETDAHADRILAVPFVVGVDDEDR